MKRTNPCLRSCLAALLIVTSWRAAAAQSSRQPLDLGGSFIASRSLKAGSQQDFWLKGGAIELGANVWHGWGVAARVTGQTTSSIGSSGVPLSLITTTFGPRYRWHAGHKVSLFGEGLVGEANGFRSVFPAPGAVQSSTNSLAIDCGAGVDVTIARHFAVRLVRASYTRTQLPNATDNVQNLLELGAGIVVRFH